MLKGFYLILAVLCCASCTDSLVFSEYSATTNGSWSKDDIKKFEVSEIDSTTTHDIFIVIRNDNTFPYSNLFLIAELSTPGNEIIRDTLEYEMADIEGNWLGKGYGSMRENKFWYKENIVFGESGVYTIELSHAMRQNGKVEGIDNLLGITDVGIEVERRIEK